MNHFFSHESLDCYALALQVHQWLVGVVFPPELRHLRTQGLRASSSVVLNIAEGAALQGDSRRNHFRIALGSAAETCSVLDCLALPEAADQQHKLRRVGAMLARLSRK